MNIFYLHESAKDCAQAHCDKHVVKMILETAQLLSTAHHVLGTGLEGIYKKTHENHPCAVWVRESLGNYLWLCELGVELCKEYTFRYRKVHKTQEIIEHLCSNIPKASLFKANVLNRTELPVCMPDEYKEGSLVPHPAGIGWTVDYNTYDVKQSYRAYYARGKKDILTYTKRSKPDWLDVYQRSIRHLAWHYDESTGETQGL